ncbi:MAG: NAD(P)H-dependent oxidoreductase [Bacteroidota bacterium]
MKTLIINGHPNQNSYCAKLAETYYEAAQPASGEVRLLNVADFNFDPNLSNGYKNNTLEPDLQESQRLILWSEHMVFVYPTWWWTMPALLKGFIDRVFVPDFAFAYKKGNPIAEKLLKGRTATLIVTMDSPQWYYRWWMKNAGHFVMKQGILAFCGIKTTKIISIDNHNKLTEAQRNKWLEKVAALARKNRTPSGSIPIEA